MENSIEYHSKQNEEISLALNPGFASTPAFCEKPKLACKTLVQNEEEARLVLSFVILHCLNTIRTRAEDEREKSLFTLVLSREI